MQMAIDKNGKRIAANSAVKGVEYRCPMCRKNVNVCQGEIKEPYFAHQKNDACSDDWVYDMSQWHCAMQSRFPETQREILITHEGKTHRADILFEKRIIEFQHSDISIKELRERNEFYTAAGYEVAWVFDLQEQYNAGRILPDDNLNGLGYKWLYPKSCLQCFPQPKDINTKLILYFYWVNSDGYEEFNKVIWSTHDGGVPDFRKFIVADYDNIEAKDASSPLAANSFFTSQKDRLALRLAEVKCRYTIKYGGFKGHPRTDYICPRRPSEFGIKRYGEQGCAYCRYCAAIKTYGKNFEAYCCYPTQVNEADELHPGYESSSVPEY